MERISRMRRVWFTSEMRDLILAGKKSSTTRNHPLKLEKYTAVSGSRFKAKPFAIIEIQGRIPTVWYRVYNMFYEEEGFVSPDAMYYFLVAKKLMGNHLDEVYYHRFKLIEKL